MRFIATIPEAIGRVRSIDRLADPIGEVVGSLIGPGRLKNLLTGTWLGHPLHPALTDVPIGAWTSSIALDLVGGERAADASTTLVGLGVVAAVPTALSGWADWVDADGDARRVGVVHAIGNSVAIAVFSVSYLLRRRGVRGAGLALGLVGGAIATGTAYLGGHLVYRSGLGVDNTAFEHPPAKWTAVLKDEDLTVATPARVTAGTAEILLYRTDDAIFALANRCSHRGGRLSKGDVSGDIVTCPWHASRFDLHDGSVVEGPATAPQPVYESRIAHGQIEVRRKPA